MVHITARKWGPLLRCSSPKSPVIFYRILATIYPQSVVVICTARLAVLVLENDGVHSSVVLQFSEKTNYLRWKDSVATSAFLLGVSGDTIIGFPSEVINVDTIKPSFK